MTKPPPTPIIAASKPTTTPITSGGMALALLLMIGGVIGAQFGVRAGQKLNGEQLRALLALMVLAVSIRLAVGLIQTPTEFFSISPALGGH